jgi:hypothetical protein
VTETVTNLEQPGAVVEELVAHAAEADFLPIGLSVRVGELPGIMELLAPRASGRRSSG